MTDFIAVWSTPDCEYCDVLKEWLDKEEIKYSEHQYDKFVQVEMIMRNNFSNPPILDVDGMKVLLGQEQLFSDGELLEFIVRGAIEGINVLKNTALPCPLGMHGSPELFRDCDNCGDANICRALSEEFESNIKRWFYIDEKWVLDYPFEQALWKWMQSAETKDIVFAIESFFRKWRKKELFINLVHIFCDLKPHAVREFIDKGFTRSYVYKQIAWLEKHGLLIRILPTRINPSVRDPTRWVLNV